MSKKIIEFPTPDTVPVHISDPVWGCGCGSKEWLIVGTGVECPECGNTIDTVKLVEEVWRDW